MLSLIDCVAYASDQILHEDKCMSALFSHNTRVNVATTLDCDIVYDIQLPITIISIVYCDISIVMISPT